jgi:hypothetical protein
MLDAGLKILDLKRNFFHLYLPPSAGIFDQHQASSPDKSGHLSAPSNEDIITLLTSRFEAKLR